MTKKAAAIAAVLALGVSAPAAYATYALSDELLAYIATVPPTNDFAVGEGKFVKGRSVEQFTLASQGSLIEAKGSVRLRSQVFGDIKGKVTCLLVTGNQAGASGPIEEPPENDPSITHFVIGVKDNGEPGGALPDQGVMALSTSPPIGALCGVADLLATEGQPVVQGNVVIEDR